MTEESVQITIPTFDDDDFNVTSIPFGKSNGFGSSGFGAGNHVGANFGSSATFATPTSLHNNFAVGFGVHDESPTPTPMMEKANDLSYFHVRGDSVTSEGSNQSGGQSMKSTSLKSGSIKSYIPTTPALVAHSSSSSITTSSHSVQSRKSFASIRNAFGGKREAPPPLPSLDHQPYAHALKNPSFLKSNSSLSHVPALPGGGPGSGIGPSLRRPSVTTSNSSPQAPRPPTPSSTIAPRNLPRRSVSISRQNNSGSSLYQSDSGDMPFRTSPPPVPKMPEEYVNGNNVHSFSREHLRTPSLTDSEEQPVLTEPRTPAEYALHAVFTRFVGSADNKVASYLKTKLNQEPSFLPEFIGPGVDTAFDELLESLAKVAQKQLKRVVESILRWRTDQTKGLDDSVLRLHMNSSPSSSRSNLHQDVQGILRQRKALISTYIACRTLVTVFSGINKDQLGSALGDNLEETIFEQFRRHDLKVVSQNANHRANVEIAAQLLGHLSNIRFETVADRFIAELKPLITGYVNRDGDIKFENLVRGIRHVQLKVWPPEAFDLSAEFVLSLSKAFEKAHGFRLKKAFAETLTYLLHSVGKTAQHEVNHPEWARAIESIYPKAHDMMSKARYWHTAYPLVITSLCVAPHEFFLKNWLACFESGVGKLKEKTLRPYILNGMVRLIWTYLYRCQESMSTTHSRLDNLLKHFFPPNRLCISPSDDAEIEILHIVHFIISRHVDYGFDLALSLMQESTLTSGKQKTISLEALAPERTLIGFRAILLSLTCMEKDKRNPVWPSSSDFSTFNNTSINWPISGERLPDSVLMKPGVSGFVDRLKLIVIAIGRILSQTVLNMSIFDDKWLFKPQMVAEDAEPFIVRQHPEGKYAFPRSAFSQIDLLITLFDSLPRCFDEKDPVAETTEMLFRGLVHVEPAVAEAASRALIRFANDHRRITEVLDRLNRYLFGPQHVLNEGSGPRIIVESMLVLQIWMAMIDIWVQRISDASEEEIAGLHTVFMPGAKITFRNASAGCLFLLTYTKPHIRVVGVKVLTRLSLIRNDVEKSGIGIAHTPPSPGLIDILKGQGMHRSCLEDRNFLLDPADCKRLAAFHDEPEFSKIFLLLVESEKEVDTRLWRFIFPSFIRACIDFHPTIVDIWRDTVNAAVTRSHPIMSSLAGIVGRTPIQQTARNPGYSAVQAKEKSLVEYSQFIDQWHFWIKSVCAAAVPSDAKPPVAREHARSPSDLTTQRERLSTARGLFRHLTAFLASEHSVFRDSIVSAFGSIHQSGFATLLDDLQPMTRHILDGRSKMVQRGQGQEHLYASVAHIYQLTAHFIHDTRSLGDHASLHLLLAFVRETRNFLIRSDNRHDHDLNALRCYFCGVVEHLFDRLNTLQDSNRFMSPNIRLSLYRLCEEWCIARPSEPKQRRDQATRNRAEAEAARLASAACGAMASLCQGAFFSVEPQNGSPTDSAPLELSEPLTVDALLERIIDMMASSSSSINASGRKALISLLKHPYHHEILTDAAIRWSFVTTSTSNNAHLSKSRFFDVVVEVIRSFPRHHFTFAQMACLGLCNLSHPALNVRHTAYNLLEALHRQWDGQLSLAQFGSAIGSSAPMIYLHAQRQLSDLLAAEHASHGGAILAQVAMRLPQVYDNIANPMHDKVLHLLEPWVSVLDLMPEGCSQLSPEGYRALCNLYSLTYRYADSYPDQIQALWACLVEDQYPANSSATVKFLIEQAARRGSVSFITYAGRIIASLSRTPVGKRTFEDLCSVIDPTGMSQVAESEYNQPDDVGTYYKADLGSLLPPDQTRPSLGTGELAMLFLGDIALERSWDLRPQLPILLHALFTHFDHRLLYAEERTQETLFQLLRAWIPGYDELPERSKFPTFPALKATIDGLQAEGQRLFWSDADAPSAITTKISRLCGEIIRLLEPLHPQLRREWGDIALHWGTSCASRPIAVRSLQVFRVLMPPVTRGSLAVLLGRLSNTIADPDESIQLFTHELLLTLTSLATLPNLDTTLLPQFFWSTYSCLSTTVEQEYLHGVEMMNALLDKIDLGNPATIEELLSRRPETWAGPSQGLQRLLILGLRSSVTSAASFKLLCRLAEYGDNELLAPGDGRLRDLFTVCLPWCLNAMDVDTLPPNAVLLGEKLARLADNAKLPNLSRIMTSFSKCRFRTKEDFLRQSVACLREYFAPKHWTEVATLLLGLVLNPQRWLRIKAMQVLKGLFSHRESRNPLELMGSELLMPLLRLLQTDLASQALEVLDEPVTLGDNGPKATQVLRMSMRMSMQVHPLKAEPEGTVFGIPTETGWCIAQPEKMTRDTRLNIMSTYDMCRMPRPSLLIFEPEPEPPAEYGYGYDTMDDDFGDLLGRLAGLNSYFKGKDHDVPPPDEPSEEALQRAQAILSKSSLDSGHPDIESAIPETPLVDKLFDVAPPSPHEDYSFVDSEDDESDGEDLYTNGKPVANGPVGVRTSEIEDSFAFDRKSRFFGKLKIPTSNPGAFAR
ncbi:hypothetical protein Clacol_004695 [Clathrus columnatus]|uniref:Cell polarity protein mor2 n=1 Tax=Clathrus columnatus TaxID=1419009 RepID=A0AAV5A771_9AGAM|nr:hypothetical protein Clacol_004695 [Clathrus columnatus]